MKIVCVILLDFDAGGSAAVIQGGVAGSQHQYFDTISLSGFVILWNCEAPDNLQGNVFL